MATVTADEFQDTPINQLLRVSSLTDLMEDLHCGLDTYWSMADEILKACGLHLYRPDRDAFSPSKNFFSLLFLYSYRRAGLTQERCRLYAATLQCLRGMVTGCDNLLDDEYKPTLETDIPKNGVRFRSVMDIMVSDRVLFAVLTQAAQKGEIRQDRVLSAVTASMQTMTRSGVEEAGEEAGITAVLEPEEILASVHHYKTGILFQCPWDIPRTLDTIPEADVAPLMEGLYRIGIGCQILDDMVDLALDIQNRKHNYLVSLIQHGSDQEETARLTRAMDPDSRPNAALDFHRFPTGMQAAGNTARQFLSQGLTALFSEEDRHLVPPATRFLEQRIGVSAPVSSEVP
jgi:hypothetical protein